MTLHTAVQVRYQDAVLPEKIRYQVNPPVCNVCEQEITRANFGHTYVEVEEQKKLRKAEQFERIECTSCSLIRESGDALLAFLTRHHL